MTRCLSALAGLALGAACAAAPALAAAPVAFRATGQVHSVTDGEPQDMDVTISFRAGRVRVVTESADVGQSVIVAQRGKDSIALLDPAQKMVVRMKQSAMRRAGQEDVPQFDTLLDPAGFKAEVVKEGKKVGPGEKILGRKTTIWERSRKGHTIRVWLADAIELPLRIVGEMKGGDKFKLNITGLDLKPKFEADEFDDSPAGYTEIKAESTAADPAAGAGSRSSKD